MVRPPASRDLARAKSGKRVGKNAQGPSRAKSVKNVGKKPAKPARSNPQPKQPQTEMGSKFEQKLKQQQRELKKKLVKQVGQFLAVALILSTIVWVFSFSPLFKIAEVDIIGLENRTYPVFVKNEQLRPIQQELTKDGAPSMVMLGQKRWEEKIAAEFPTLEEVVIAKNWPNKVVLMLKPREPVATVNGILVDKENVKLGPPPEGAKYPVIESSEEAANDCLLILSAIQAENLNVAKIVATTRNDITLVQHNNFNIVLGSINDMTLKLADIHTLLGKPDIIGDKTTLDVSSPKSPVLR